jgi:hypothetical protein
MDAQDERADPAASWLASVRQSVDAVAQATDARDRLVAVERLGRYVDRLTAELVTAARAQDEPLSWAQIGGAMGMTRQAANERFSEAGQRGALHRRSRRARKMADLRTQASGQRQGNAAQEGPTTAGSPAGERYVPPDHGPGQG